MEHFSQPSPVLRLGENHAGRDYVVGDIHGEFGLLEKALKKVFFEPESDRLFAVGDLIDRGANSPAALEWLAQPWFFAVCGNHEEMAVLAEHDPRMHDVWMWNGGTWWLKQQPEWQAQLREALRALPLAIDIQLGGGRNMGIVHADVPPDLAWEPFLAALEAHDPRAREYALWSRERVRWGRGRRATRVAGVLDIFCGHTPVSETLTVGNVHFIDTGACYAGRLTLLPLTPSATSVRLFNSA